TMRADGLTYTFLDESFDGSDGNMMTPMRVGSDIDQVNFDAYDSGVEWHRDYVYYGLTPTTTSGPYKEEYREQLRSLKFLNGQLGYQKIADQTGDPTRPDGVISAGLNPPGWTEGFFEF